MRVAMDQRGVVVQAVQAPIALHVGDPAALAGGGVRRIGRHVHGGTRVAAGQHALRAREECRRLRACLGPARRARQRARRFHPGSRRHRGSPLKRPPHGAVSRSTAPVAPPQVGVAPLAPAGALHYGGPRSGHEGEASMNGAESLARTLVAGGVNVCFTNPGTSEMHFVAALDKVDGIRCVLGLFEGVVTGAADGYWRMAGRPAATLLHLGPGLGNGLANLHNARKASSGIVNVVGEHATYHIKHDAPLTSDIEGIARPVSNWVRTSQSAASVASDGAAAITAASTPPGQIATLILPADTAWNAASGVAATAPAPERVKVSAEAVARCAKALGSGEPAMLFLTGQGVRERGLTLAGRIATTTGARILAQGSNARIERGAGRVPIERLPYPVDQALAVLKDVRHLILVGSKAPVAFFAYPDKPSVLTPDGCQINRLFTLAEESLSALGCRGV